MNWFRPKLDPVRAAVEINEDSLAQSERRLKALEEVLKILEVEIYSYKESKK